MAAPGDRPDDPEFDDDGPDDSGFDSPPPPPDAWPALMWVGLGVLVYAGTPDLYDTIAGIGYFIIGAPALLTLMGNITARFNQLIQPALNDLFPGEGQAGSWLSAAMRWMVIGMEALVVIHLSRITIVALSDVGMSAPLLPGG